jgi:hypothetical protein
VPAWFAVPGRGAIAFGNWNAPILIKPVIISAPFRVNGTEALDRLRKLVES